MISAELGDGLEDVLVVTIRGNDYGMLALMSRESAWECENVVRGVQQTAGRQRPFHRCPLTELPAPSAVKRSLGVCRALRRCVLALLKRPTCSCSALNDSPPNLARAGLTSASPLVALAASFFSHSRLVVFDYRIYYTLLFSHGHATSLASWVSSHSSAGDAHSLTSLDGYSQEFPR